MPGKNEKKLSSGEAWHNARRKRAFKATPKVRSLYAPDKTIAVFVLFYPILHFLLALVSAQVGWWSVLLLAWIPGAYLVFAKFNHLHEMSHGLIFGKMKTVYMDLIMRWIALPDVTGTLYYYYRYHHLAHHKRLGKDTLQDALDNRYQRGVDLDLVLFAGKIKSQKNRDGENTYVPEQGLFRVFFAGILPLLFLVSRTMTLPRNLYWVLLSYLGIDNGTRSRAMLSSYAIQNVLWVTIVAGLTLYTSSWKPLAYLSLSQLFYNGFLWHPYLTFWLGIHKTGEGGEPTQSIYGSFMVLITQKMSLHVEHHDFPQVPIRKLPLITKMLPDYYRGIPRTQGGYFQIMRDYYSTQQWVYGGQTVTVSNGSSDAEVSQG